MLFLLDFLSLCRLMAQQSQNQSPRLVLSHLYSPEVDLHFLRLDMLQLEIFYIHSTCELRVM